MPTGDHFYCTDSNERDVAIAQNGYKLEGNACFVFPDQFSANQLYQSDGNAGFVFLQQESGTIPLFELVHPTTGDYFYTTNLNGEGDQAMLSGGYRYLGRPHCFVFGTQVPNTVPLFRAFRQGTSDHLYTISVLERDTTANYMSDGTVCFVHEASGPNTASLNRFINRSNNHHMLYPHLSIPSRLIRMFNPDSGDHFYTLDGMEAEEARKKSGYQYDYVQPLSGIGDPSLFNAHVYYRLAPMSTPFFRLYRSGDHFYTTSEAERDNAIANIDYLFERIECYVYPSQLPGTIPLFRLIKVDDPAFPVDSVSTFLTLAGNHIVWSALRDGIRLPGGDSIRISIAPLRNPSLTTAEVEFWFAASPAVTAAKEIRLYDTEKRYFGESETPPHGAGQGVIVGTGAGVTEFVGRFQPSVLNGCHFVFSKTGFLDIWDHTYELLLEDISFFRGKSVTFVWEVD